MAEEIASPSEDDAESQALRHQLEQTRSALASKLESLQKRLSKSVETACDAVDETMHSAKQTAQDAVQSIKQTLDLKQQVVRHPWTMMGVATCVGVFLAKRGRGCRQPFARKSNNGHHSGEIPPQSEAVEATAAQLEPPPEQLNTTLWLKIRLQGELDKLRDAATGAGVNIFRDWMKRMMPRTKKDVAGK